MTSLGHLEGLFLDLTSDMLNIVHSKIKKVKSSGLWLERMIFDGKFMPGKM